MNLSWEYRNIDDVTVLDKNLHLEYFMKDTRVGSKVDQTMKDITLNRVPGTQYHVNLLKTI